MTDKKSEDFVSDDDLKLLIKKKRINSRTKGNSFERKIAKLLNEHYKTDEFMRTPGSGAFATTHKLPKHLQVQGDLITPLDYPWLIECKSGYKFLVADLFDNKSQIHEIWNKLISQCQENNKQPLLIFKQDRKNILCALENDIVISSYPYVIECFNFTLIKFEDFLSKIQPTL